MIEPFVVTQERQWVKQQTKKMSSGEPLIRRTSGGLLGVWSLGVGSMETGRGKGTHGRRGKLEK